MRTIEVIISPKGEPRFETKGFAGSSCQEASRFLEEALGAKLSDKPTAEFYQTLPQGQMVQQGGSQ